MATLIAIAPPLWFAEGMAEYPVDRSDQRGDRHVAPRRGAGGKAPHHRADDDGPVPVLPLPLRSRALVLRGRALGRRGGRRDPQGDAGRRRGARLPAHHRPHSRPAVRAVARRGPEAVPARDRGEGAGQVGGGRAPDREAVGGDAAPRPRALARRVAGGVLQREGLLLGGHVPRRRRHRQGQASDPQVGHQQQLRDLPLHQLARRTGRRTESSWPSRRSAAPGTRS